MTTCPPSTQIWSGFTPGFKGRVYASTSPRSSSWWFIGGPPPCSLRSLWMATSLSRSTPSSCLLSWLIQPYSGRATSDVCARAMKLTGFLYRSFRLAASSCLNHLFKALVLPVLVGPQPLREFRISLLGLCFQ